MSMIPGTPPDPAAQTTSVPPVIVNVPPQPAPTPDVMTRAEVERLLNEERERVRKEEKDKLYPQLESLNQSVRELTDERNNRIQAEEEAARQLAEEERRRQEEAMTVAERFEQYKSEQDIRFEQLRQEAEMERALRAKETEFAELERYRSARLSQESETIAPQLRDLIRGNTKEEIDASITDLQSRTQAILEEVQQANLDQRRSVAPAVSGAPPVDMSAMAGGENQRTLTPEEIRDMPPEEYSQYRSQLLTAASERVRQGGIYAP